MLRWVLAAMFGLILCRLAVLAQDSFKPLEQAVRLIEQQKINYLAREINLPPEQVFLATDIAGDGRYLRYELASEEGFYETRLITMRPDQGVLLCRVRSACGPVCEQGALQCFQVSAVAVTDVTAEVIPRDLYSFLAGKIKNLQSMVANQLSNGEETCPFLERIILPREEREAPIKLGYVCGRQPAETVVELAVLEFQNGKFVIRELP